MRGASALQQVLSERPGARIRAFVVWEPVLWSDIAPPIGRVLAETPDRRARQYWDRDRLLSAAVVQSALDDPGAWDLEEPFAPGAIVWDYVALYSPGARWDDALPAPAYQGYPVVEIIDELRRELEAVRWPAVTPAL